MPSTHPALKLPLYGKMLPVIPRTQSEAFVVKKDLIYVKSSLVTNLSKLEIEYNKFCEKTLRKIIDSQIKILRKKRITVPIQYTDGTKSFYQNQTLSIDEYLKILNYSSKILVEIGKSNKEWGLNKVSAGNKQFTLFFNVNLIKYDNYERIKYVVAHELTHIFHRDHGAEFQKSLKKLYPKKEESESFFKYGIKNIFQPNTRSTASNLLILVLVLLTIILIASFLWGSFLASQTATTPQF